MALKGQLVARDSLDQDTKRAMLALMQSFYDGVREEAFANDLSKKDTCILLYGDDGSLQGFSTQQVLTISVGGGQAKGVFSGDTIIHPDSWGSLELYKVFARHFFDREPEPLYWFLISKGYKTYKMLPTFMKEFWPRHDAETPADARAVMAAFGAHLYPGEYNPETGVVEYRGEKDKLKAGVADVTPGRLRDADIAFFVENNPGYARGNDLVCLTRLSRENLVPRAERLLFQDRPGK